MNRAPLWFDKNAFQNEVETKLVEFQDFVASQKDLILEERKDKIKSDNNFFNEISNETHDNVVILKLKLKSKSSGWDGMYQKAWQLILGNIKLRELLCSASHGGFISQKEVTKKVAEDVLSKSFKGEISTPIDPSLYAIFGFITWKYGKEILCD